MADNIFGLRWALPIYKDQTNPANVGVLAEAADVIVVLLKGVGGTPLRQQNLTLASISDDGQEIAWEYDATNQYVRPQDIVGILPKFQYECPDAANYGLVAVDDITVTVTAFEVNGVETTGSWPVTAVGAAALELALQEAVGQNGAVTVNYVDTGTDYLQVYVMQTTAAITINGTDLDAL
jgi:hypothetical protein